jgi:Major Facilitator Superfamily
VLAAGNLSDRLGRKGVLLVGLVVFGLGSYAGAASTTAAELIASRAVMGLGAAVMFPSTLSLLVNVFVERRERARAIGLWGATTGIGIATGPIVGGWLLQRFWWGSIFALLGAIAVAIIALVAVAVPTSRDAAAPPLDVAGLGLSAVGMTVLVLGVIEAPDWGWGSRAALGTIAAGVLLLAGFVFVERRVRYPMIDIALFRNLRFTAASGSVAISFFALQGFIFLITQYFQFVKNYSPLGTGVRLLPVASSVAVTSILGTRLAVRIGNKAVVTAGMLLFAAGLAWTSTATATLSYTVIVGQMLLLGAGMGLTSAPATEAIMGAVPQAKAGIGSAINDATRLFGATLGVAVVGSAAASLYTDRLVATAPAGLPDPALHSAQQSIGGAIITAGQVRAAGLAGPADSLLTAATNAFLHSLSGGCWVAVGVTLAGALMAALLLPSRPATATTAHAGPTADGRDDAEPATAGTTGHGRPSGDTAAPVSGRPGTG